MVFVGGVKQEEKPIDGSPAKEKNKGEEDPSRIENFRVTTKKKTKIRSNEKKRGGGEGKKQSETSLRYTTMRLHFLVHYLHYNTPIPIL